MAKRTYELAYSAHVTDTYQINDAKLSHDDRAILDAFDAGDESMRDEADRIIRDFGVFYEDYIETTGKPDITRED